MYHPMAVSYPVRVLYTLLHDILLHGLAACQVDTKAAWTSWTQATNLPFSCNVTLHVLDCKFQFLEQDCP